MAMGVRTVLSDLEDNGWCRFSSNDFELEKVFSSLGKVIRKTKVSPAVESRSLVKSTHQLPLHTDHYLAKFIVWECIRQDQYSGFSVLIDGIELYESMPKKTRDTLDSIQIKLGAKHLRYSQLLIKENSDLDADINESHPMINKFGSETRIFYQNWMIGQLVNNKQKSAFQKYVDAVRNSKPVRIKLNPGECLAVDNGRILHGRDELSENSNRLLIRYWIS